MKKTALSFILLPAIIFIYLFLTSCSHNPIQLPIYYPENISKTISEGKEITDTIYHTVPAFKFINQNGDTVTENNFKNKIYVANFFFTTCPSVCPKMMSQMERVNTATQNSSDFLIISHSVNPSHDSVAVLAEYAQLLHADPKKWMLVTGMKKDIYNIAIDGYKLGVGEDVRAPGGFLHSEIIVLVDKGRRIRGYYDGLDSNQVNKLISDLDLLRTEYEVKK